MVLSVEQVAIMLEQEATTYRIMDYLAPGYQQSLLASGKGSETTGLNLEEDTSLPSSSSTAITESWREKICEWCYQVIDHFDFSREVVSVAMHYLDRYLSRKVVNKRIFQLAAMASLQLAIKLNEKSKLSMSAMIELSRGYFSVQQMESMELSLMRELGWQLHPPCAFTFVKSLLNLFPSQRMSPHVRYDILELSRFLTELSVIDCFFVPHKPSHIAVAALANAMQDIPTVQGQSHNNLCDLILSVGIDVRDDAIMQCRHRMQQLYWQGGYGTASEPLRPESTPSPVCVSHGIGTQEHPEAVAHSQQQDVRSRDPKKDNFF